MNIFVTDGSAWQSASNLCDIHVNKMILETAQLLSTAHHEHGTWIENRMYKPTHKNHPSAVWARETGGNYAWLFNHFNALIEEKLKRTGKLHASSRLRIPLANLPDTLWDSYGKKTSPPQCMPDEFKDDSYIHAYRKYLNAKYAEWMARDKPLIPRWTGRPIPSWVTI